MGNIIPKDKIGIVGYGYVGKGTEILVSNPINDADIVVYDKDPSLCKPEGKCFDDLHGCMVVFVCVPTPMNEDGSCHTDIVSSVVCRLKGHGIDPWRIIIRSTVPVGTSEALGVNFMPEFLAERTWKEDAENCKDYVLGVDSDEEWRIHDELRKIVPWMKKFHIFTTKEAELIKYVRNTFLATKVSFFNEIAAFCEARNIDYEMLRKGIGMDERVGINHTQVPGPDGKKGFGGTCFPKDANSLVYQMEQSGLTSYVLEAAISRNESVDRPEEDWKEDRGRVVV